MRIANNIMAMNTHRAYTSNNDKVQASAEKLSSGYRINRAGDDAAGLAISEKMRSQIRGLNMATKNSQDAVSLIQTAEGALQEVHSMLQRMNELAVQSATGTNEGFDRTQIAKEFEQLKREINDISEQTTFNNMNILDGSLSAKGLQRSAYTSGVYANFEESDPTHLPGGIQAISNTEGTPFEAGYAASFSIDLSKALTVKDATNGVAKDAVVLKIDGKDLAVKAQAKTVAEIATQIVANSNGAMTLGGVAYSISVGADGTSLKFTATSNSNVKAEDVAALKVTAGGVDAASLTVSSDLGVTGVTAGKADKEATISESRLTFNFEQAKAGDKFTIGGKEFTFYDSVKEGKTKAAEILEADNKGGIDLATVTSAKALMDRLAGTTGTAYAGITYKLNVNATPGAGVITIEQSGNDLIFKNNDNTAGTTKTSNSTAGIFGALGYKNVQIKNVTPKNNQGEGVTTFELDVTKLKVGDKVTWKNDNGGVSQYEFKAGDKASNIIEGLSIKASADGTTLTIDGNTWKLTGKINQSDRLGFVAAADYKPRDVMKIQVGAQEGEQLGIKINAMNTKGLALDEQGIYTQESAGKAITATRTAINTVSDQRALLGAMQNRMTHKIANLKVSVENLQASESRIRDIDIASEMTTFTKNNILSQAATSMLAQANSAPQNVLSLLR